MNARNQYKIRNIIFYILLVYQLVILILGNMQYRSFCNAPGMLCLVALILIYTYLFMIYVKGVCVAWNEFCIRLILGEFYTYYAERLYCRKKCILLIAVAVASSFAVIATIANIIVNGLVISQTIFGFIGISTLLMLVLSIAYGLAVAIEQIKNRRTNDDKGFILYKSLILQNFLIALSIINMLCHAQI